MSTSAVSEKDAHVSKFGPDAAITFTDHVFPLELEQIAKRQEKVLGNLKPGLNKHAGPLNEIEYSEHKGKTRFAEVNRSTKLELFGLALSGGGIRSATFNLGVLQSLAEHGILQLVDYVSTVSGGGYLGACLSSVLNRDFLRADGKKFPFAADDKGLERAAIKQLRNNSNYLAPRGLIDLIRIPALLIRGILINSLVLFPYIVLAVWVTLWVCGEALRDAAADPDMRINNYMGLGYWVLIPTAVWFLLSPVVQRWFSGGFKKRNFYERSFGFLVLLQLVWLVVLSLPTILSAYHYYAQLAPSGTLSKLAKSATHWGTIVASAIPFLFAGKASGNVSKLRGKLVLYGLGLLGPLILVLIYLRLADWAIYSNPSPSSDWIWFSVVAAVLWVFTLVFVDVNKTSLHAFYRDRLSNAYLFQLDSDYNVSANDEQRLSELNAENTGAPYHLINCALNLQSSEDPELRGRNADFFILSKNFVGGRRTGYCPTTDMEEVDPHMNLGTAMAISGAAAAPNMGTTTIKPLVFIMTLLNVRLGYWMPNPGRMHSRLMKYWLKAGVGPLYLLNELTSRLNERSHYVNLSDGGHIENLGIYELLRRRCKFIIASDAEADKNLSFHGLATLIRYARIDMGINIEIELDEVRKNEAGLSRKKCALGKIRYPEGETGHLLYIKSSFCGVETEYIREYRSRNLDFPHESTGDQFFDETQFEAYRALGYHTASLLFQESELADTGEDDQKQVNHAPADQVDKWFGDLKSILRPRFPLEDKFLGLQDQLGAIERAFADPAVARYSYQIYPEITPTEELPRKKRRSSKSAVEPPQELDKALDSGDTAGDDEQAERYRRIFHLCNLQLQLMENAFIGLELDKPENRDHYFNRGWMNLFRRWSQAAYFRRAWAVTIGTFSVGFQKFCEDALLLEIEVRCKPAKWSDLSDREKVYITERKLDVFVSDGSSAWDGYQYHIWLSELWIKLDLRGKADPTNPKYWDLFPIGCSIVRFPVSEKNPVDGNGSNPEIVFYRIRRYYRQMRLFERMMESLGETLTHGAKPEVKPIVIFPDEEQQNFRLYGYFFERCGYQLKHVKTLHDSPSTAAN